MEVKKLHGNGNHLILDGISDGDLGNVEFIKKFLINLTKKIKMNAISEPLVFYYGAENKEESGITGVIILAESNITIHTYPSKKWFCLDIFSCNEFEIDKTITYLTNKLNITKYKKQILKRGNYDEGN